MARSMASWSEFHPGMLVRVEIYLLPDGTWQVQPAEAPQTFYRLAVTPKP